MNMIKSLWILCGKHVGNAILSLCSLLFCLFVVATFSDMIMWLVSETDILLIGNLIGDIKQFISLLILTAIILIITICIMFKYFVDVLGEKNDFSFKLMVMAFGALSFMLMILIWLIFSPYMLKLVHHLLDTPNKTEALSTIGYGMGGVLAFIGAISINRRANAEAESNRLIEKGHVEDRFKTATKDLQNLSPVIRISAFYQFYYLAKHHNVDDFRRNIFDVLCVYLRHKFKPIQQPVSEELQTLLDVLFKSEDHSVFGEFHHVDLQGIYLSGANFMEASLSGANLTKANLTEADLTEATLTEADLTEATLTEADFTDAYLTKTKFIKAILVKSYLKSIHVTDTNFECADLTEANFEGSVIERALFVKDSRNNIPTKLPGANFTSAAISDTNFSHAILTDAQFTNARLTKINFQYSDLTRAIFSRLRKAEAEFQDATLIEADFTDTDLAGANFAGADLSGAQLLNANFEKVVSLEGAQFHGAKFGIRPITRNDLPTKWNYTI